MAHVLLLRAPSGDIPDRYEAAFSVRGYTAVSVPVLETVLTHADELRRTVARGPGARYGGVIVTSARACEAWKGAADEPASWSSVPFYVVGEATAAALAAASPHPPLDIRGGAECGTSERLARFIVADRPAGTLLYLTGDKNRDTLAKILGEGGVELDALQVYGTQGSSTFAQDLEGAVARLGREGKWWVVFFAPSAAEFVAPVLRGVFELPGRGAEGGNTGIGAIGPTTSGFLEDVLGVRVDVTARKPTAEELAENIWRFDQG